jgi:predicted amidohydrolase
MTAQLHPLSRRNALAVGVSAAAISVAHAGPPLPITGTTVSAAHVVLVQNPWRVGDLRALVSSLPAPASAQPRLIVVGHAEGVKKRDDALADATEAAKRSGAYIAASMTVMDQKTSRVIGILVEPTGRVAISVDKIVPNAFTGFDAMAATVGESYIPVIAETPMGRIAVLPGEDVFAPARVRVAVLNGAEIIINPAVEVGNEGLAARRDAAISMAYHHGVFVLSATPARSLAGQSRATRTAMTDWTGAVATADGDVATFSLDVERLRRVRQLGAANLANVSQHLLPMVRDALYAEIFSHNAKRLAPVPVQPRSPDVWQEEFERLVAIQDTRTTPREKLEPVWEAVIVQSPERSVRSAPDRKAATAENVKSFLAMAAPYTKRNGVRLVMYPEFAFTAAGFRTVDDIRSVALVWGGRELEPIQRFAQDNKVYVAFQQLEADPKFPGRVFNTAFLVDDSGQLIARHRKLQCVDLYGTLPDTTPGSIYDAYIKEYGIESLVQIADTPLGKIGMMVCYEMMFPEVRQSYAQLGAEVMLHLTAEGYDSITETRYAWNGARRQTAMESSAYLLCANKGDENASPWKPIGESQFIDPYGRVLGQLRESKPGVLMAKVELPTVWAARRDPTANLAVWDRPSAYVAQYRKGVGVANNLWADNPDVFPYLDYAPYREVHRRLYERGVYVPPRPA